MAELNPEADLEWIPRPMRAVLDRGGIKLHLKEWQALPLPERQRLAQLADAPEVAPFAAALRQALLQYLGKEPDRLAPHR